MHASFTSNERCVMIFDEDVAMNSDTVNNLVKIIPPLSCAQVTAFVMAKILHGAGASTCCKQYT